MIADLLGGVLQIEVVSVIVEGCYPLSRPVLGHFTNGTCNTGDAVSMSCWKTVVAFSKALL